MAARLLGLRANHPAALDGLELLPGDAATRADAAYSAARVLSAGEEGLSAALEAEIPALPVVTAWQRRILRTAVRFIGYPYVWGGTSEAPDAPAGIPVRGGFDCSGFVWRVRSSSPTAASGASRACCADGQPTR